MIVWEKPELSRNVAEPEPAGRDFRMPWEFGAIVFLVLAVAWAAIRIASAIHFSL